MVMPPSAYRLHNVPASDAAIIDNVQAVVSSRIFDSFTGVLQRRDITMTVVESQDSERM